MPEPVTLAVSNLPDICAKWNRHDFVMNMSDYTNSLMPLPISPYICRHCHLRAELSDFDVYGSFIGDRFPYKKVDLDELFGKKE